MRGRLRFETVAILGLAALCAVLLVLLLVARGGGSTTTASAGTVVAADAGSLWSTPEPSVNTTSTIKGPEGERALRVRVGAGRRFFAVLQARFSSPQDWSSRSLVLLNFEAGGTAQSWQAIFTFGAQGSSFAVYTVPDRPAGWRQLAFGTSTPTASQGTIDWSHVTGIELTRVKAAAPETIAVGALRLAEPFAHGSP